MLTASSNYLKILHLQFNKKKKIANTGNEENAFDWAELSNFETSEVLYFFKSGVFMMKLLKMLINWDHLCIHTNICSCFSISI